MNKRQKFIMGKLSDEQLIGLLSDVYNFELKGTPPPSDSKLLKLSYCCIPVSINKKTKGLMVFNSLHETTLSVIEEYSKRYHDMIVLCMLRNTGDFIKKAGE